MPTPPELRDGRYADTPIMFAGDYHPAADSLELAVSTTDTQYFTDVQSVLKANSLKAGSMIEIDWKLVRTGQNSTNTQVSELVIGPNPWVDGADSVIATHSAANQIAGTIFAGHAILILKSDGASGKYDAIVEYQALSAVGSAIISGEVDNGSIDTTVENAIGCTVDFSAASTGNKAILEMLSVRVYPAA